MSPTSLQSMLQAKAFENFAPVVFTVLFKETLQSKIH